MAAKKRAKKASAKKAGKKAAPKKAKPKKAAPRKRAAKASEAADWRVQTLVRVRRLIQEAVPGVVEEAKWRKPSNPAGVPTWSREGILCTGETYKGAVKVTFAKGAALQDPARLFNASLEGGTRRAIDIREGDAIDEEAFKALVREAAALNEWAAKR